SGGGRSGWIVGVGGAARTQSAAWTLRAWDRGARSCFDLLGHGLRRAPAAPSGDVAREGAGPPAGGHDQDIIRRFDERPEPRLVTLLDRAGHALGSLQMGERVLRVLPEELTD